MKNSYNNYNTNLMNQSKYNKRNGFTKKDSQNSDLA